ncbi:MAG: heme-dependent peroxidase [Phycisphaerales bacterium]|nr:MAG: heme-dependent peroxidase [Phycisphaerales bacterium]
MSATFEPEAPQTLEGWFVLKEVYSVDWPKWRALDPETRDKAIASAEQWLDVAPSDRQGGSAVYSVLTQKGDLMFVHYRSSPDELNRVELSLRQLPLFEFLVPAGSFLSVIELELDELAAIARRKLTDQGIIPGAEQYDEFFETEMAKQKQRLKDRLFPKIPNTRYICFYPMTRRRGGRVNWYTLAENERRELMRGVGRIGHAYHEQVTQIVSGAIGLDDWEWGVSLYADDMLVFKKLLYEMRFDTASALYAEFGPVHVGIRVNMDQLGDLLTGYLT